MKKLEESLDFLQRHEEKLWFWGVDRAEDMGFSAEFLREAGLKLDHRSEFPAGPRIYRWHRNAKFRHLCLGQSAAAWPNPSSRLAPPSPAIGAAAGLTRRSSRAMDCPLRHVGCNRERCA